MSTSRWKKGLKKAHAANARRRSAARRAKRRREREREKADRQHMRRLKQDGERRLAMFVIEGMRDARAIRETGRDTQGRVWT